MTLTSLYCPTVSSNSFAFFFNVCLMPFNALALTGAIFFAPAFSAAMVDVTACSSSTSVRRKAGGMCPAAGMGDAIMAV